MLCSEVMRRDVERSLETSSVTEAAVRMRDRNIGFLPVCSASGVVVGALTDRDIAIRVLADRRWPEETRVSDVMTREVVACRPSDELAVAQERMIRFRRSRIMCLDESGNLTGVLSLSRIAKVALDPCAGAIASALTRREAGTPLLINHIDPCKALCRDVMKRRVRCCQYRDVVPVIAQMMCDHNIGFVPVCDATGAILGTITDRDLTLRVVAERRFPLTALAEQVLTPGLVFCSPDDPLGVAEELMVKRKKSRIVCSDSTRQPLGVISLSDIARLEWPSRVIRILSEVSSRDHANA